MAQSNISFKLGNAECEFVTGLTFSDTNATEFSHYLGATPDVVIAIPTNKAYVVVPGATAASSTKFYLTAENASGTASALLIKASNPATLV
jgi:hypothetical protein